MPNQAKSHEDDNTNLLVDLRRELDRVGTENTELSLDDEFEPEFAMLLKVKIGPAFWHLPIVDFRNIIRGLKDGSGEDAIQKAIESEATHVWHGPSPKQTRSSTK